MTPGVEATTGPLGQGTGNAIGMAIAESQLAALFNRPGHEIVDHHTYFLASDGDLMHLDNDGHATGAIACSPPSGRVKSCLILAAGRGTRMQGAGDCKPLLTVGGLPLIERTVATAAKAGLTQFYVVTGHQAPRLEAFLATLGRRHGLAISAIRASNWEAGNAASLLARPEV